MSFDHVLATLKTIEPFPVVATRVLAMAAQPDVVPSELIAVIHSDPGVTAKVLKLTNSSFYGFARHIGSLQEAGNLLGVNTLVSLVTSSCAGKYFDAKGGASSRAAELWERCTTIAVAARLVARRHEKTDPERAFTAGLLQEVGELVIERHQDGGQREAIAAVVARGKGRLEAEREVLTIDHAEIGARLAARWGLPDVLVDTIRNHHEPGSADRDPNLTCTAHLAEMVVAARTVSQGEAVCPAAYEKLGITPEDLNGIEDELTAELQQAREALAA